MFNVGIFSSLFVRPFFVRHALRDCAFCARVAKHCSVSPPHVRLSQSCANPNSDDHSKRNDDELQMARGDMIHLEDMDEEFQDGWWFGKHVSSGEKGLFPACMS